MLISRGSARSHVSVRKGELDETHLKSDLAVKGRRIQTVRVQPVRTGLSTSRPVAIADRRLVVRTLRSSRRSSLLLLLLMLITSHG